MKDIYLYDNSNVLKNKLNITDKSELETIEADFLAYRILELDTLTINSNISVDYLKEIHKHLFQDIYDWAGKYRKIDIEIDVYANKSYLLRVIRDALNI